jgi:hypothetical protein
MSKKYKFSFWLKQGVEGSPEAKAAGVLVPFEFDTYEEALKEAKFYIDVFFGNIWRKLNVDAGLNMSWDEIWFETMKVADSFELTPNESNFDFMEHAKYLDKRYTIEESLYLVYSKFY